MNGTSEIIVDSFAGGGGASLGIEMALGRSPDIAINHDAEALSMHEANHPTTLHLPHNVWKIDPHAVTKGRPVGLLWASPDCKHFSKAKGGKPVKRNIRDLAWVVVRWAKQVRPRVILLENVEEFTTWGPLTPDSQPDPAKRGETFAQWIGELRRRGYKVEHRELRACDYGAPTIRKRLFLVARCDGRPILWPTPTHADPKSEAVKSGTRLPWRAAAEIIDWSLPCPSIFLTSEEAKPLGVKRPLADATMARIAKGVMRYVIDAEKPFIVTLNHQGAYFRGQGLDDPFCTVTSARDAQSRPRGVDEPLQTVTAKADSCLAAVHLTKFSENSTGHLPDEPLHTVMAAAPRHGIVAAFLAQHNGGTCPGSREAKAPVSTITASGAQQAVVSAGLINMKGSDRRASSMDAPHPTVTAQGLHSAEVRAFLVKYYGEGGQDQTPSDPLHTIPTRDRFGLVMLEGEPYEIADIGMRMLTRRELFRAQGFPDSYQIERGHDGRVLTQSASIRMCGNSVSPVMARALVAANYTPDEDFAPAPKKRQPGAEIGPTLFEAAE
jgi:DNA (cytosine-5)-methyltransferase 1